MQLKCEQCGAPFGAADLHLDRGIAVCSACGGVQRLPGPVAAATPNESGSPVARKPPGDIPIPAQFTIEDAGHALTIRRRWFQWGYVFLIIFAIAWDSFLVGWYWMLIVPNDGLAGPPGPFKLIFFVFPLIHVAVGAGLTYFSLAGCLNSTVIRVADGIVSLRHGPLPWLGNVELPTDSIEQIYCQNKLRKSRNDDGRTTTSMQYEVHAVVGGQKQKLLGGLSEADHALFVEQRLERFLGIEDRPVLGEMSAT